MSTAGRLQWPVGSRREADEAALSRPTRCPRITVDREPACWHGALGALPHTAGSLVRSGRKRYPGDYPRRRDLFGIELSLPLSEGTFVEPILSSNLAIHAVVFIGFIFCIIVHECAHGLMAYWRGDDTAMRLGRITLDPIPHIDPWMSILMPAILWFSTNGAFVFGGAKPVPVVPSNLRDPKRDMMLVAWAGPVSNILLAVGFALVLNLIPLAAGYSVDFAVNCAIILKRLILVNLVLAFFNLIPIPPLDGSKILAGILPTRHAAALLQLEPYGLFIVMGFLIADRALQLDILFRPVFLAGQWIVGTFLFVN